MKHRLVKIIFLTLAFLFLGLGAIGVVLPILPTTPFLLLASLFFAKGSDRFHQWFMKTGLYKKYLQDFIETRSMTRKTKIRILITSTSLLLLAFFMVPYVHAKIFIAIVMIVKYWYFIFRIKVKPPEVTHDKSHQ